MSTEDKGTHVVVPLLNSYHPLPAVPRAWAASMIIGSGLSLVAGVFMLPYWVPVLPSIGLSYISGFNNHVAIEALVVLGLFLAFLTDGVLPPPWHANRRLPRLSFILVLLPTVAVGLGWCHHQLLRRPFTGLGSESPYFLDRQIQLEAGKTIYRGFEFIYGPLLLYPSHWLRMALHLSTMQGYVAAWTIEWIVGISMLWFVISNIALPTKFRLTLFIGLCVMQLNSIPAVGQAFTPMRYYAAAFLCTTVFVYWRRHQKPYATVTAAATAIALGFAISSEQGIALVLGLSAYSFLLAWKQPRVFPFQAAGLLVIAGLLICFFVLHSGELETMRGFAAGAYNFPLLPSFYNMFVLSIYVCGLGLLYRGIRYYQPENIAVPLGLCGIPLLASALGRCDQGHVIGATPLFLVGIFSIAGHPRLFKVWIVMACYFFLYPGWALHMISGAAKHAIPPKITVSNSEASHITSASQSQHPIENGRSYFAPWGGDIQEDGQMRWHADDGYYRGFIDISPGAISSKSDEISQVRAPFLILPDTGEELILTPWRADTDLGMLPELEHAFWYPHPVHQPINFDLLVARIRQLYEPTDQREDGWRVWKLRSSNAQN